MSFLPRLFNKSNDRVSEHKALREYRRLGDDLARLALQVQGISNRHPSTSFTPEDQLYAFANTQEADDFYNDFHALLRKHNVSIIDWHNVYLRFNERNEEFNLRELGYAIDPY